MQKIGLLTCQRLPDLADADRTLIPLFYEQNILAEAVIWNDSTIDWNTYDALIIRNTWDYYTQGDAYITWLESICNLAIPIFNEVDVVLWNIHKFYLKEFHERGIQIIPTLFSNTTSPLSFEDLLKTSWGKIIVKPAISAGSYQTQLISVSELDDSKFSERIKNGDWLVQPFLPEIAQGELSMIFFNGSFSHAVIKKPKHGDFRVQKQYGGIYSTFQPSTSLLTTAKNIVDAVDRPLLYARVDGVMMDGKFHLMELELIEPDLYFEFGDGVKQRFVQAVLEKLQR